MKKRKKKRIELKEERELKQEAKFRR